MASGWAGTGRTGEEASVEKMDKEEGTEGSVEGGGAGLRRAVGGTTLEGRDTAGQATGEEGGSARPASTKNRVLESPAVPSWRSQLNAGAEHEEGVTWRSAGPCDGR